MAVIGWNVYRSLTQTGVGTKLNSSLVLSPTYTDNGVTNGVTYWYYTTAVDGAGLESQPSGRVSATPNPSPQGTAPSAPSVSITVGDAQATLAWLAVNGATSYDVYQSTAAGILGSAVASNVSTTGWLINGLANGTTYYFTVRAKNAAGTSPNSNQVTGTPNAQTGTPVMGWDLTSSIVGITGAGSPTLTTVAMSGDVTYGPGFNGQTISLKRFTGAHSVIVTGSNITFDRCSFEGGNGFNASLMFGDFSGNGGTGNSARYCDIGSVSGTESSVFITAQGATLYRCLIQQGENYVTIEGGPTLIDECYMPDTARLGVDAPAHYDAIEIYGGHDIVIRRCAVFMSLGVGIINVGPFGGGAVDRLDVYENWFDGVVGGLNGDGVNNIVIYYMGDAGVGLTDCAFYRNRFGGHTDPGLGIYSALYDLQFVAHVTTRPPPGSTAIYWPTDPINKNTWYLCSDLSPDLSGDTISVTGGGTDAPPTAAITAPVTGTTVAGTITVTGTATDDNAVAEMYYRVDGVDVPGSDDFSSPYSWSLDTTTLTNGTHTIATVAKDSAGQITASTPVTVTVSNGAGTSLYGDATNTGYRKAPGYPGSLTTATPGILTPTDGTTISFKSYVGGVALQANNITFIGCRFAFSGDDANFVLWAGYKNVTFQYCTFEPSAVTAPPASNAQGFTYGIFVFPDGVAGHLTLSHCDIWGFAQGIQIDHFTQTDPLTIDYCYFHDARADAGIDHTDGILNNDGNGSYATITHTSFISAGTTNAIGLQGPSGSTYDHITVTNNYFSGFGRTVRLGSAVNTLTNVVFTDNVIGNDILPSAAPLYTWTAGTGNLWRRNKWHRVTGGSTQFPADNTYWWPDTGDTNDWFTATHGHSTDYTG